MWSRLLLLLVCCCAAAVAVFSADGGEAEADGDVGPNRERTSPERAREGERTVPKEGSLLRDAGAKAAKQAQVPDAGDGPAGDQLTSEPLKDEEDNQENIMTQLLGDYDKEKDKRAQQRQEKKKKVADVERPTQKNGAAVFTNKQKHYEERYVGGPLKKNQQPLRNNTGNQTPVKDKKESQSSVKEKNNMVIRGVTFYMAEGGSKEEEKEQRRGRGDAGAATLGKNSSVELLISDQLPPAATPLVQRAESLTVAAQKPAMKGSTGKKSPPTISPQTTSTHTTTVTTLATTTAQPTTELTSATPTTATEPTTTTATTTTTTTTKQTTSTEPSTTKATTTIQPISPTYAPPFAQPNTPPVHASPAQTVRSRLSWTENPADRPTTTKKPGVCKDTVASISEPVQQHSYGHGDGAWMRDARGHGNVIYLTNGHYGNNLLEFRDMDTFRSGQASNSYKLPYSFTGTGHVVFNGAFYYNRAFSRDIIRYDLRHRYVAAWTTLHDALLEEQVHRAHTEVEFAVDESGLWLLYPALDTEGFHQEVILLTQLHPRDLQPIRSFRTGMRRSLYGDSFLVCGVLYAVDSMERLHANVTYAFDTHTLTHTVPKLAFTNMHAHTSQLSYCPLDRKLYGWDNGHQMLYDVIFAY
ncbi:olfactomedin-like protein 2B isoform X2 [Lampris incognitus]|uniref:olfactomedin-like protein 2B isoform X2 n=1 Tax=Lampris incognitus TaxID=2546036 RepID=UPI0024B4FE46|nr:olfactomedin-like protein 2B isoform X2 [Lampris incognitus]